MVTAYVLIVLSGLTGYVGGNAVIMQEFRSEQACAAAKAIVVEMAGPKGHLIRAICVPK